jgi:hypothetical protein
LFITPTFSFAKKETWGYSLSPHGISTFKLEQGSGFTMHFGRTTAQINKTSTVAQDYTARTLTKDAEAWWASRDSVPGAYLASDVLTLLGAAAAAVEQNENPLNTYNPNDPVGIILTYDGSWNYHHKFTLCTMDHHGNWINAVDLNFGGTKNFISGPWNANFPLGSYGFDPATRTAWAVVNHDSDFAVIKG